MRRHARMLAVLASIALGAAACSDDASESADRSGDEVERTGDQVERGDESSTRVAMSPQRSDGTRVVVDEVVLADGAGYVVIYSDGGGAPGRQLGVSDQLSEGVSEDVAVELDEPLDETAVVHAMVHLEDNENDTFDYPAADEPASLEDGIVEVPVEVTVSPVEN